MIILTGVNSNNFFKVNKSNVTLAYVGHSSFDFSHPVLMINSGGSSLTETNTFENYNFDYFLLEDGGSKNVYLLTSTNGNIPITGFRRNITSTSANYYQNFIKQTNDSSLIETKNFYLDNTSIPTARTELSNDSSFVIGGARNIGAWTNTENSADNHQKIWIHNVTTSNTSIFNIGGPNDQASNRNVLWQSYDALLNASNLQEFRINTDSFNISNKIFIGESAEPITTKIACRENLEILTTNGNYNIDIAARGNLSLGSLSNININADPTAHVYITGVTLNFNSRTVFSTSGVVSTISDANQLNIGGDVNTTLRGIQNRRTSAVPALPNDREIVDVEYLLQNRYTMPKIIYDYNFTYGERNFTGLYTGLSDRILKKIYWENSSIGYLIVNSSSISAVFKTTNGGSSFSLVFDNFGSKFLNIESSTTFDYVVTAYTLGSATTFTLIHKTTGATINLIDAVAEILYDFKVYSISGETYLFLLYKQPSVDSRMKSRIWKITNQTLVAYGIPSVGYHLNNDETLATKAKIVFSNKNESDDEFYFTVVTFNQNYSGVRSFICTSDGLIHTAYDSPNNVTNEMNFIINKIGYNPGVSPIYSGVLYKKDGSIEHYYCWPAGGMIPDPMTGLATNSNLFTATRANSDYNVISGGSYSDFTRKDIINNYYFDYITKKVSGTSDQYYSFGVGYNEITKEVVYCTGTGDFQKLKSPVKNQADGIPSMEDYVSDVDVKYNKFITCDGRIGTLY